MERLAQAGDYPTLFEELGGFEFGKLSAARGIDVDPEIKDRVQSIRNKAKDTVKKWKKGWGSIDPGSAGAALALTKEPMTVALRLAMDYAQAYQAAKKEKNLVDFGDMEHYALELLAAPGVGGVPYGTSPDAGAPVHEASAAAEEPSGWGGGETELVEEHSGQRQPGWDGGETGGVETGQVGREAWGTAGGFSCTPLADELSMQYDEILVDEYQDSNLVQETLVNCLSGERFGKPNVFLVGDVKQSIYKFRLARPELFLAKYESYRDEADPGENQKIELHQNFRSRQEVLRFVNDLFYRVMGKELGGIDYDERAALYAGAVFAEDEWPDPHTANDKTSGHHAHMGQPSQIEQMGAGAGSCADCAGDLRDCAGEPGCSVGAPLDNDCVPGRQPGMPWEHSHDYMPELLLVETGEGDASPYGGKPEGSDGNVAKGDSARNDPPDPDEDGDGVWMTAKEAEAAAVAQRIRALTHPVTGLRIWDKDAGRYRCAQYGDIVILFRAMANYGDVFAQVLGAAGIDTEIAAQSGYFSAYEVEVMLALLSVIDNPLQDIPLAVVLRSPIGAMTDEDLAVMVADCGETAVQGLYGAVLAYMGEGGGNAAGAYLRKNGGGRREAVKSEADKSESGRSVAERSEEDRFGANKSEARMDSAGLGLGVSSDARGGDTGHDGLITRDVGIMEKLRRVMDLLQRLRHMATYLPTHQVLLQALAQTGFYDYAGAMPGGAGRKANLDMLVEKAVAYEKTSYRGLFHFLRYIEKLKKYDTDFGEAPTGDRANSVRLMSVHKSKGLEFPIVFLCGMGKRFNKQDLYRKMLIDTEWGLASDAFDLALRVRFPTLKKEAMKRKLESDNLGEELRVLYVALTRAKEKLILTASGKNLKKRIDGFGNTPFEHDCIPASVLAGAQSYLDWVLMAMALPMGSIRMCWGGDHHGLDSPSEDDSMGAIRISPNGGQTDDKPTYHSGNMCAADMGEPNGCGENVPTDAGGGPAGGEAGDLARHRDERDAVCEEMHLGDTLGASLKPDAYGRPTKAMLLDAIARVDTDSPIYRDLEGRLAFAYPYAAEAGLAAVYSVSEIKRLHQAADVEEGGIEPVFGVEGAGQAKPGGAPGGSSMSATERGSAYHRVLQLLDIAGVQNGALGSAKDVAAAMSQMEKTGHIGTLAARSVRPEVLWGFLDSPLGRRMSAAAAAGKLRQEQQFVVGLTARKMGLADSDELILVQGMIDAYWEEDGGVVLLDYKTDALAPGRAQTLVAKYQAQMDYYAKALTQILEKPVKETYIYSLALQEAVRVATAA
jgi:ATP-dependent helicase/nuclease subunit A